LSVYGFFLSIFMFDDRTRTRYTWYASIVFWIVFLVSFVWWYTASYTVSGGWQYVIYMDEPPTVAGILAMLSPLVYATGCLTYFMSRTPRQYFSSLHLRSMPERVHPFWAGLSIVFEPCLCLPRFQYRYRRQ
jgi:hypothetical protein